MDRLRHLHYSDREHLFLVFKEFPVQLKIPASAFLSENITTQMLSYAIMSGIMLCVVVPALPLCFQP